MCYINTTYCKALRHIISQLGVATSVQLLFWALIKISKVQITIKQDKTTNVISDLSSGFDICWTYCQLTIFMSLTFSFSPMQCADKKKKPKQLNKQETGWPARPLEKENKNSLKSNPQSEWKPLITILTFDSFDVFPGDKSEIYQVFFFYFLLHCTENVFLFLHQ